MPLNSSLLTSAQLQTLEIQPDTEHIELSSSVLTGSVLQMEEMNRITGGFVTVGPYSTN